MRITSSSVSVLTRRDSSIPTFPRISLAFAWPIPWMYCNPTTTRLAVGMLTPAIRAKVPTPSKAYGALVRARMTFRWPRKSARLYVPAPPSQRISNLSSPCQNSADLTVHIVHSGHPIDLPQHLAGAVVGQQRLRLGPIGGHPGLHRLGVVVLAAGELLRPADIANTVDFGTLEFVMVARPALRAGEAADHALGQRLLVHLHLDHAVERFPRLGQHL